MLIFLDFKEHASMGIVNSVWRAIYPLFEKIRLKASFLNRKLKKGRWLNMERYGRIVKERNCSGREITNVY